MDEGIDIPMFHRCGDVDGDTVPDYLITRLTDSTGGVSEGGSVELISGATSTSLHRWFGTQAEAEFGAAVATLDDVDGDGIQDIAIGSPDYSSAGMTENGAVFVYSGAAPYGLIDEWVGLNDWSGFGTSVADAGDKDGDGASDLLIGAPREISSSGAPNVGGVYVFAGGLPQAVGLYNWFQGVFSGQLFGETVLAPGDFDGDGIRDWVIGSPGEEPPNWSWWYEGEAFIHSGANGAVLFSFSGEDGSDRFGNALASPGDFDGDGTIDLLVAAPLASPISAYDPGQVFLYSGATGEGLHFWVGEGKFDWFGYTLDAGDVTGDGKAEILVGAPLMETNSVTNHGGVYAFDGVTGERVLAIQGDQAYQVVGAGFSYLGDLNSDGIGEFAVSQFDWSAGLFPEGRGDVYSGAILPQMTANGNSIANSSGGSVQFTIDFPNDAGLYWYQLLFSAAGTGPVDIDGLPVPLSYDLNLVESYLGMYNPAFSTPSGILDLSGDATSKLSIPAGGIPPSLINTTMYFAAICKPAWGNWEYSSVALPVTFLP